MAKIELGEWTFTEDSSTDHVAVKTSANTGTLKLTNVDLDADNNTIKNVNQLNTDSIINNNTQIKILNPSLTQGDMYNLETQLGPAPEGFLVLTKTSGNSSAGGFVLDGIGGIGKVFDYESQFQTSSGSNGISVYHDGTAYIIEVNDDSTVRSVVFMGRRS